MSFRFDYLIECIQSGIPYIPGTLKLTIIVFLVSAVLGWGIATIRYFRIPVLSKFLALFVTVYMGVPNMLALNVYYLFVAMTFNDFAGFLHLPWTLKDVNFMSVAYFTMILSNSCWMSEDFRGAYKAIDKTQFEAGYSIGFSTITTLRRIIVPQMVPVVLPNMLNWLTGTVKNVSLISAIGLAEIMGGCIEPCGRTYSYLEGYVAAAIIYWIIVIIIEQFGKIVERRGSRFRRQVI